MKCGGTTHRYNKQCDTHEHVNEANCFLFFCLCFFSGSCKCVSADWQMIAVLVDKLIRTQVVDCAAVANWLFSQDMAHEFTRWDTQMFRFQLS